MSFKLKLTLAIEYHSTATVVPLDCHWNVTGMSFYIKLTLPIEYHSTATVLPLECYSTVTEMTLECHST